ncbi:Contactin-3 [Branchiostoma belcheri]|nr:Contactin-3 [Branchiostoma belcheri]
MESTSPSTGGSNPAITGEFGAIALAWVIPFLFFLVLWIVLIVCCFFCEERCKPVRDKIGLERKYRELMGKKNKLDNTTISFAASDARMSTRSKVFSTMSPDRQAMLRTYRNTIIDNMKSPTTVASYLAQEGVIHSATLNAVISQPTPEDKSKKLLDALPSYDDESYGCLCASLREQEKLHWLADTLEGEGLSVDKKKQIASHRNLLVNKMDPDTIVEHLSNNKVFTGHMANCCLGAMSREDKNKRILHLLPSRSDRDFGLFCTALRTDDKSAYLADLLEGEGVNLNTRIMDEEAATVKSAVPMQSAMKANSTTGSTGEGLNSGIDLSPNVKMDAGQELGSVGPAPGRLMSAVSSAVVPVSMPVILEVSGEVDGAQWLYNGESLARRPGFRATSDGFLHELHIDCMTPDLDGTYTCQGRAPDGGTVSCEIKVTTVE